MYVWTVDCKHIPKDRLGMYVRERCMYVCMLLTKMTASLLRL